jgi:hypothetical protein
MAKMRADIDLTDLPIERALKKASDALTASFERIVDSAGIRCRAHGGTPEEVASIRDWQRQRLERCRAEHLDELRRWLLRGLN